MSPDVPPVLAFDRVTLAHGARTVLDAVSFRIAPGEFVGLLGPNGAGKTTLLRAALGLVPVRAGNVRVFGQPVPDRAAGAAIGYLPQATAQAAAGRLRGWDHVAAVAAARQRWPMLSRAVRHEVDRALDLVDAGALARRPLAELSGGERQRVMLAQALLGRPRLLLLDEPLMALDPGHQHEVVALVRRLQAALGLAVVFSAHEVNPLLGAMDRVLYLGRGRAAIGPVDQVVTGPVLSGLYGTEVEVVRAAGRVFVMIGHAGAANEAACHHGTAQAGQRVHG